MTWVEDQGYMLYWIEEELRCIYSGKKKDFFSVNRKSL